MSKKISFNSSERDHLPPGWQIPKGDALERKPELDSWVNSKELPVSKEPTKRLTLDIAESLHKKIKMKAAELGVPMADMLRELLEQNY